MQAKKRLLVFFSLRVLKVILKEKKRKERKRKEKATKEISDLISHPISELSQWQVCFEARLFRHIDFCCHFSPYFICHIKAWKLDECERGPLMAVPQEEFSKSA